VSKCKCTTANRVLGDGCRYCQPQEYIDRLHEQFSDEASEIGMLQKRIAELEQAQRWIPVGERLPDQIDGYTSSAWVLVSYPYGKFPNNKTIETEAVYVRLKHGNFWKDTDGDTIVGITHWMKMPKAPEVE